MDNNNILNLLKPIIVQGIINTLPNNPSPGDAYIASDSVSGHTFQHQERKIAIYGLNDCGNSWCFIEPYNGLRAIVCDNRTDAQIFQPFKYSLLNGWEELTTPAQLT